jgi:hypothetical protein
MASCQCTLHKWYLEPSERRYYLRPGMRSGFQAASVREKRGHSTMHAGSTAGVVEVVSASNFVSQFLLFWSSSRLISHNDYEHDATLLYAGD